MFQKLAVLALVLVFHLSAHAQFDVPKLCHSALSDSFGSFNKSSLGFPEEFFLNPPAVVAAAVFKRYPEYTIPWLLQDLTRPNVVKAAYLIQHVFAQRLIDQFYKGVSARKVLEAALQTQAKYSPTALKHAELVFNSFLASRRFEELARVEQNVVPLCAPYLNPACPAALRDVIKIMDSRVTNGKYIQPVSASHPESFKRILADPSLIKGVSHFTLRVMDHLETGAAMGANLFDDLKNSFIATGSTPEQAEDRTWVILTFYATRGASLGFFEKASNAENLPVFLSLYLFSSALGTLDLERVGSGSLYSYPSEIKTTCAMGRPYHFWMAAALARDLGKRGHSARASVIATHLVGKLYEFGAPVFGRDNFRPYLDVFFNSYNVTIQVGLAYKTAALLWATQSSKPPFMVNQQLLSIFKAARPMPKLTPEQIKEGLKSEVQRYRWFHRVIAPDAALSYFGKVPFDERQLDRNDWRL